MNLKRYSYKCTSCGESEDYLVEYEKRNEEKECSLCEQPSKYSWAGGTLNVSTRNSATMPAEAGKGRFTKLREQQVLKKEIAETRATGNRKQELKAKEEMKKL